MVSSKQVLLFVVQKIQGLNFGSENIVIILHNQNLPILSGKKLIVVFEKKFLLQMKKEVSYQMTIQSSLIWSGFGFCILLESRCRCGKFKHPK